jgi:FO synthase
VTSPTAPTAREIARSLGRAARGVALDVDEATSLLHARGDDLETLLDLAAAVRDRGLENAGRPGVITYSRKVFIPLTRLCRDRCHYCTFATDPASLRRDGHGLFLTPDEVLDIARQGAALGCKEALFTLGDRPEERWPAAREWLDAHGYDDTLSYLRAMAVRVLEETGLLPHLNPGVMSWEELGRLKPVAPSMGMMLETSSRRLWETPGAPHFGSPDKEPAVRLRVLSDAGRQAVPFTTGVLVGIGETPRERVEALLDIRRIAREYGHVQEVIVQNFRAKPDTAMRGDDDLPLEDYLATIAVARLLLGPRMRVQAPPNLTAIDEVPLLLRAGVDDWGGVSPLTPDHVNPERPWPHLDELARVTASAGFVLRERLTAHPEYVLRPDPWTDPRVRSHVAALADASGLAVEGRSPAGIAWQEADLGYDAFAGAFSGGRTDLHETVDTEGRTGDRRSDFDEVYGDWSAIGEHAEDIAARADAAAPATAERLDSVVREALSRAAEDPASLARARHSRRSLASPTTCVATRWGTTSPTSSTATSTSPTSATPAAASARSPNGARTRTRSPCRSPRWVTGSPRRGTSGRPRCACRAASTPISRGRRTSTWPGR